MENQKTAKTAEEAIKELRERSTFEELLAKARTIKEKNTVDLFAYSEFTDLLREAYLKGYFEGGEMSRAIYGVGEYSTK